MEKEQEKLRSVPLDIFTQRVYIKNIKPPWRRTKGAVLMSVVIFEVNVP